MNSANDMRIAPGAPVSSRRGEVELLAFHFWLERGAPIGTPDIDWFHAEKDLELANDHADPALSAIAKTIGAALGSVAALVNTNR